MVNCSFDLSISSLKVCNDVRSDVESSSEDESSSPAFHQSQTKMMKHAQKVENGTNGHCTATRSRPYITPT